MTFIRKGDLIETEEMTVNGCDEHINSGEGVFLFCVVEVDSLP